MRKLKTIDQLIKYDRDTHHNHFLTQAEYVFSEHRKVKILRFENLKTQFREHFNQDILHVNPSKRRKEFRGYYRDSRCKKLVLEIYRGVLTSLVTKRIFEVSYIP